MKQDNTVEIDNDYSENTELGSGASVDDFIRELEEKERDLHITAELQIEVSQSEFDDSNLPEFVVEELRSAEAKPKEVDAELSVTAQMRFRRQIDELETTISKFKTERTEILERSRRQGQDFENFKIRTERERNERLSVQMENLAAKMLPVLDNLDRAMDSAMAMSVEGRAEIEQFLDGISLVHRQINDVLEMMGAQPINAVGQEFDPHFHEAVATEPNDSVPTNTVTAELLRGFRMGNRVLRHAMVRVAGPTETVQAEISQSGPGSDQTSLPD